MGDINLRLWVEGIDGDAQETSDLLRALEGCSFTVALLKEMTRLGFEHTSDPAARDELRETSIEFFAKRAEEAV